MPIVSRVEDLKMRHPRNGSTARPNVHRRNEAQENTNAYLVEMARRAGGIEAEDERTARDLYRTVGYALLFLFGVGLSVLLAVLH